MAEHWDMKSFMGDSILKWPRFHGELLDYDIK